MLILAIDTSGRIASCALYEDGALRASCNKDSNLDHSRTILPLCHEMIQNEGLEFGDIDVFASAVGPGSFTGIRIGVSAVKGFALAGDKPCSGVSTLEAAAYNVPEDALICSIIRAREDEYFYAFFRARGGKVFRLCADEVLEGRELKALLYGAEWILCGDGAEDFIKLHPCENARFTGALQDAGGVARAAWAQAIDDALINGNELTPVYLKKTQAERMREEKQK